MATFLHSQNLGHPYKRKKKGWNLLFFCCKVDVGADGDGPKAIPKRFGFTNLNPKPFVIVVKMR
jgi:hypothetical protein